jgi:antitoxin (DNA-binding transcriptional repressor) of toxin-antitoxin stability system
MKKKRNVSIMSLNALRPELFRVVPKIGEWDEPIILTHHRRPVAVIVPLSDAPADTVDAIRVESELTEFQREGTS